MTNLTVISKKSFFDGTPYEESVFPLFYSGMSQEQQEKFEVIRKYLCRIDGHIMVEKFGYEIGQEVSIDQFLNDAFKYYKQKIDADAYNRYMVAEANTVDVDHLETNVTPKLTTKKYYVSYRNQAYTVTYIWLKVDLSYGENSHGDWITTTNVIVTPETTPEITQILEIATK